MSIVTESPAASDRARLAALAPDAEALFERHLKVSREWFPHELVPWSQGRDFVPGEPWNPADCPMPAAVRSALVLNLLTEDNLPYYFHAIANVYGSDGVWGAWSRRWTAEEHRHSIVLRDWLTVTRAVDPVALERSRMTQVSAGFHADSDVRGVYHGLIYVTLQELATRVAHRNTGRLIEDPAGQAINARVAADENLHYLFYRDVATAALSQDPSGVMMAIDAEVRGFQMPGAGLPGFAALAAAIANAGIYDFGVHYHSIVVPTVFRQWRVDELTGLDPEAEIARDRLLKYLSRLERVAARQIDQRSSEAATAAAD